MTHAQFPIHTACCSSCRLTRCTSILTLAIVACLAMQQSRLMASDDSNEATAEAIVDAANSDTADTVAKVAESIDGVLTKHSDDTKVTSSNDTGTLSVAPSDHVEYPADRASWVTTTPQLNPDSKTIVVTSGAREDQEIADEILQVMTRAAIETYVQRKMEAMPGPDIPEATHLLANDRRWIEDTLITRRYQGGVKVGDMPRFESAVMLTFDDSALDRVNVTIRNHQVGSRLLGVGVFAGIGFLGLLSGSIVLGNLNTRRNTSP